LDLTRENGPIQRSVLHTELTPRSPNNLGGTTQVLGFDLKLAAAMVELYQALFQIMDAVARIEELVVCPNVGYHSESDRQHRHQNCS